MEWGKIVDMLAIRMGILLIQAKFSGDDFNPYLKVVVDTYEGITIKEITRLTKQIRKSEQINNLFQNGFRLEVTSPGLDYPLTEEYQFRRNIGKRMIISHNEPGISNPIRGVLKDFKEGILTVEEDSHFYSILFSSVIEGKLILQKT